MIERAIDLYQQFHAKDPKRISKVPVQVAHWWRFGDAGRVVLIVYRSAKWSADGRARNYVHTFESDVRFGEPWRRRAQMRAIRTGKWPREIVDLGELVNAVVERRARGSLVYVRPVLPKGTRLCATADGKRLVLYHPRHGILAALVGPNLRVTPRGVEG